MKKASHQNYILENPETKKIMADAHFLESEKPLPLVFFVHGYKGYKDWGAWNLMAESFAKAGFFFVKFNFSHNGITMENPNEFSDLESFGQNNYSKEISDLEVVIDYFSDNQMVNKEEITLIGHSRGGGISIIKASEDPRIKNLITLASVDSLNRFPKKETFESWKNDGVFYVLNGRTGQKMPHYFQFYEDYKSNEERFSVEKAIKNFKGNLLIIHGTEDEAVSVNSAEHLHQWNPKSELVLLKNAQHTFGAKEPWTEKKMPSDLEIATDAMIGFLGNAD